jgi:hypothetical protein
MRRLNQQSGVKWTVTKVRIEDECAAVLSKSTIAASK